MYCISVLFRLDIRPNYNNALCRHSIYPLFDKVKRCYRHGSSYDSIKRDDIDIAQMDIDTAGKDRCPVNDCIKPGIPIQGAVDNFAFHSSRAVEIDQYVAKSLLSPFITI